MITFIWNQHLLVELPDADDVVIIASEQSAAIRRPRKAVARRSPLAVLGSGGDVGQISHDSLGIKVENADSVVGGGSQPILVGGELKGVHNVAGVQAVHVGAFVEVPHHDLSVLATRSAKSTIRGDRAGVDESSVSVEVELQLEVSEVPNLMVCVRGVQEWFQS